MKALGATKVTIGNLTVEFGPQAVSEPLGDDEELLDAPMPDPAPEHVDELKSWVNTPSLSNYVRRP